MEIESALVAHPQVAEAAVVGKAHEIKGESVFAFVVLNGPKPDGDRAKQSITQLRDWVGTELSPIAKPDDIRFADNLPKTRSGKIMRRLLRAIARGEQITQDISTLENPAIIEQLRGSEDRIAATALATAKPAVRAKPAARPKPSLQRKQVARRKTTARKLSAPPKRPAASRPGKSAATRRKPRAK